MFCRRYAPLELLPRVDLLCHILMQSPKVTGVALTGSLARLQPKIHDIDLVVFHNGELEDGSAVDPERDGPGYGTDLILACIVEDGMLSRMLTQARGEVSVNYIFVREDVLWNCEYLRSLEAKERFPEFYLRVFSNLPLVLLSPYHIHGELRTRAEKLDVFALERFLPKQRFSYPAKLVQHMCSSAACKPKVAWENCRRDIRRRKGHWWHL